MTHTMSDVYKRQPYAVIYDFVTLPRPLDSVSSLTTEQAQRDLTLVKNELCLLYTSRRIETHDEKRWLAYGKPHQPRNEDNCFDRFARQGQAVS